MGLSLQLEAAVAAPKWTPTKDGYVFSRFGARAVRRVTKRGRAQWFLILDGKEHDLGRRASFDHAEGIIAQYARRAAKDGGDHDFD